MSLKQQAHMDMLCCLVAQVQLERLTASFQNVTEDMRQRFVVDGQTMLDESIIGTSPIGSFRSNSLKNAFRRTSMGPSGTSHNDTTQITGNSNKASCKSIDSASIDIITDRKT